MEQLLKEYLPILIFLCIAVAMAVGNGDRFLCYCLTKTRFGKGVTI